MRNIVALLAFLLTALPAFAQSPQLSQGQVLGNFAAGLRPAKATGLLTFPVVSGNSACFSGTTGLLQDCGLAPSLFVPRDVRWPIGGSPGAVCDWNGTTGTDDTAAIQRALDNYKSVLIPKNCAVSSTLTFGNLAFATITGISGAASSTNLNTGSSVLVATNANLPVISVVSTIPGLTIKNLGITRSVLATAGGNGIQFNGYNDNPIIDNVEVEKQFIGLDLTASGYGILRNSFIHDNMGDNVYCDGPRMTIVIQCQWYLFDILSSRAGGGGTGWNYNVVAPATAAIDNKMTMGTWTETKSFSGATGGANFTGNANVAVQGVRLAGGFYGESGGAELNLNTFNSAPGPHQISDVFFEINHNGACVNITGNNATVNITGGSIIGCNTSGINNSATQLVVSGTQILNNTTFGIVNGGIALVTGSNLGNNTSGPVSNLSVYVGRSNTPTTANTVLPVAEGGTGISSLGTGVATALGIAVGSAGGPVVNGGALGTPSSGVGSNLTALNASNLSAGTVPNARLSATGAPAQIGAVATVKRQSFCPSGCTTTVAGGGTGTYTPSVGMLYAVVEMVGGGGGGGSSAGTAGSIYGGAGGSAGTYTRSILTAATVGASKSIVIGALGAGGASGSNVGAAGTSTCLTTSTCVSGQIVVAPGGAGGQFGSSINIPSSGAASAAGTGDLSVPGGQGTFGAYFQFINAIPPSGAGASGVFGTGGSGVAGNASAVTGTAGAGYGSGGSGGSSHNIAANAAGGPGTTGIAFITEFNSQ